MLLKSARNETSLNRFYNLTGSVTLVSNWTSQFHYDGKTGPRLKFLLFPSGITPTAASDASHSFEVRLSDNYRTDKTFIFYADKVPAGTWKVGVCLYLFYNNEFYAKGTNTLLAGTHVIADDSQYDIGSIGTHGFGDINFDNEINSVDGNHFFTVYTTEGLDFDSDGVQASADLLDDYTAFEENRTTQINQSGDYTDD